MHPFISRLGFPPVALAPVRARIALLGIMTEPMAAVLLLPVLALLLASTADLATISAVIVALGLVLYQACAAMGGRYIV